MHSAGSLGSLVHCVLAVPCFNPLASLGRLISAGAMHCQEAKRLISAAWYRVAIVTWNGVWGYIVI